MTNRNLMNKNVDSIPTETNRQISIGISIYVQNLLLTSDRHILVSHRFPEMGLCSVRSPSVQFVLIFPVRRKSQLLVVVQCWLRIHYVVSTKSRWEFFKRLLRNRTHQFFIDGFFYINRLNFGFLIDFHIYLIVQFLGEIDIFPPRIHQYRWLLILKKSKDDYLSRATPRNLRQAVVVADRYHLTVYY